MTKALVLAGGNSSRLQPLSNVVAASLLPLCDRELLHYQIAQLARAGIGEIIIAAGPLAPQIAEYISHYRGIDLQLSVEEQPLGTAGAIANAAELIGGEQLLVLNGDILSSVDLGDVLKVHNEHGRVATLVGYAVDDPARYGLLKLQYRDGDAPTGNGHSRYERDGELEEAPKRIAEVTAFIEKASGLLPEDGPFYVNAGIYVLEPEALAAIPPGRAVSIEHELFPLLLQKRGSFTHYPHTGIWGDLGSFEGYFRGSFTLLAQRFTYGEDALWGHRDDCAVFKDLVYLNKSARLGSGVDLFHRVIAMRECVLGAGSRLQDVVMMPGSSIGAGCNLKQVLLGPGVSVPEGAELSNRVLVQGEEPQPFYPGAVEILH